MINIHHTAIVGENVRVAENVEIGPFTTIEGNTEIGSNTIIGPYCHLGVPSTLADSSRLIIGEGSLIRSHSVFYVGSSFGSGLVTGHRVTVRENTIAGENLQIGTLCDIQGHCKIGNYVRCHSNVHIGQRSTIGNYVWIFPYVVLTNDPHPPSNILMGCKIGDYAAIATMSVILPGVIVGEGALVGAFTVVREAVPNDAICVGSPGKIVGNTSKIKLIDSGKPAYPWRRHFHRGYPPDIIARWQKEFEG